MTGEQLLRTGEVVLGTGVALLTLLDVFATVIVPGATRGWLQLGPRIGRLSLPLWTRKAALAAGPNRISAAHAATIFAALFLCWMLLLVVGFGLVADGLRADYTPPITSLSQALFTAGSAIVTIGESGRNALGPARWAMLASGFAGLAVVTMAITYILEVQGALQARDAAIAKLTTTAGRPATGVALLQTYAELGCGSELGMLFREWRDWMAATLNSHCTHPVLGYFRSTSAEMDWPLATSAVLDAAALYAALVAGEHAGVARLLHRDGCRMAATLVRLYGARERDPEPLSDREMAAVIERLREVGYPVTAHTADLAGLEDLRRDYAGRVASLATHFGVDPPRFVAEHAAR